MEYGSCNVVYVDRRAHEDKLVHKETIGISGSIPTTDGAAVNAVNGDVHGLDKNLENLLATFSEVYVCSSGDACVSKLTDLNDTSTIDLIPTVVLIDIPYDDPSEVQNSYNGTPLSPTANGHADAPDTKPVDEEFYGVTLLQWITSQIQQKSLSKLMVPIAVITVPQVVQLSSSPPKEPFFRSTSFSSQRSKPSFARAASVTMPLDQLQMVKYLDLGAVDVLTCPLSRERLPSLAIHAYRAHKELSIEQKAMMEMKRTRKRSWVGVDDEKPYAYLRESMVSNLMDGICRYGEEAPLITGIRLIISDERQEKIKSAIGTWTFSAHEFTDEELLLGAVLMLEHALEIKELEQWRISRDALISFLTACRAAYNAFVPYHNFRHVIDVMQATFHFLLQIGAVPAYPPTDSPAKILPRSTVSAMIRPFDALTLLITAIGHDVGHPGVNNAFLVTLSAPLAQLYNDRSVLEAFHCAAYSQILRRYWPTAFSAVEMRQLMISSILATDMGLHFEYMKKMGFLEEKLHENTSTDSWNGRQKEEYRTLACSLLIKCADISNVARRYDIASQWTMILIDEFSRQASMETDLGIPSALFAPPVREIIALGKSQIGFINMFAIPLFQGVTHIMPAMKFCVDELHNNISIWEGKIEAEQTRQRKHSQGDVSVDGRHSPRALSPTIPSDEVISQALDGSNSGAAASSNLDEAMSKNIINVQGFNFPFKPLSDQSDKKDSTKSVSGQGAVADAPVLFDHAVDVNNDTFERRRDSDTIGVDPAPATQKLTKSVAQNRSSETTQESNTNSTPGSNDWASQATSGVANKQPISPSTQGTSIMSDEEDASEKQQGPSVIQPLLSRDSASGNCAVLGPGGKVAPMGAEPYGPYIPSKASTELKSIDGSSVTVMEAGRGLAKKPSKSRFKFWRRTRAAEEPRIPSPPMSSGSDGIEDKINRM